MTKSERVRSELERVRHAIEYRLARREAFIKAIARWTEDVKKLKKQEARLQVRLKTVVAEELSPGTSVPKAEVPHIAPKDNAPKDNDLTIPGFLQRAKPIGQKLQEAHDKVAEEIRQEQAEKKKAKAKGQAARRKAFRSGEAKKMPLSGKAALKAIRDETLSLGMLGPLPDSAKE